MPLVVMDSRPPIKPNRRDSSNRRSFLGESYAHSSLREVGTASSLLDTRGHGEQRTPPIQEQAKVSNSRPLFGLVEPTTQTTQPRHVPNFHLPSRARANNFSTSRSPAIDPSPWPSPIRPSPLQDDAHRHPADTLPIFQTETRIEAGLPPRAQKPRRKRRQRGQWTRKRKTQGGSRTCAALFHGKPRSKFIIVITSGLFLITILTIYVSVAMSVKNLGQEIHILFIITTIAATVFFAHALGRLALAIALEKHPNHRGRRRPVIPSVVGPEGFKPDVPIRVALARDEELAALEEDGSIPAEKLGALQQPPPAYGLWRCSVRIDPNLLHWQRVNGVDPEAAERAAAYPIPGARLLNPPPSAQEIGPINAAPAVRRPPSYVSDDGVSYIVSALPPRPPSEIHPALRIRLP